MLGRVFGLILTCTVLAAAVSVRPAAAQLDPTIRDRVIPAAVEVALLADVTDHGQVEHDYLPVGSGTIVSPDGLVLTNWHVVDRDANRDRIADFEATQQAAGQNLTIDLDPDRVLVLTTNGVDAPQPAYLATVAQHDAALDLAVLTIVADDQERALGPSPALPFVPLGDSDGLRLGDPLHVFGYPGIGGDVLTYTPGVVSSFEHEDGIAGVAWVTTDAVLSAGSSGGAAINTQGELVGVPTQGSALDCRPGDTNGDGTASAADTGCLPYGGSLGEVRPINLAKPLLAQAGLVGQIVTPTPRSTASSPVVAAPSTKPTATAAATSAFVDACWTPSERTTAKLEGQTAKQYTKPPAMAIDPNKTYTADLQTNKGDIEVEFYPKDAPQTVNNFICLARDGYYDGTPFHRIVKGFVIQGGDPTGTGMGGPGYKFNDEPIAKDYEQGVLAMANAGPNTNGSQFFIVLDDLRGRLPKNYTIFGKVTSGMDVVQKIANTPTKPSPSGEASAPTEPVTLEKVTVQEK